MCGDDLLAPSGCQAGSLHAGLLHAGLLHEAAFQALTSP